MDRKPRRSRFLERTAEMFDLPADALAGLPKVELTGERDLYLLNFQGILSYGREEIHVDSGLWVLRILGRELELRAMRAGELRITGVISRLEIL